MSSSISRSKPRFLFDENVDKRLEQALKKQGIDVMSKPKSLSNGMLAEFSKSEKRILVTNDEDFTELTKDKIFSVVWLRISQRDIELSIKSFSMLLEKKTKPKDFEGFLIVLKNGSFESFPLGEFKAYKKT